MSLTEKQRHDLKKFLKELEFHKGRHTELVSVYIPQGYDMIKIIQPLDQVTDSRNKKNDYGEQPGNPFPAPELARQEQECKTC